MKRRLLLAIMLGLSPILGSTTYASSQDLIVLEGEEFDEFLLTGKVQNKNLNFQDQSIRENSLIWVHAPSLLLKQSDIKIVDAFQPVWMKQGMLFIINYAREHKLTKTPNGTNKVTLSKANGVMNLPDRTLVNAFGNTMRSNGTIDYPKFPVVFRTQESENLSLLHLTYTFNSTSPELIALKDEKFKFVTEEWIKIPQRIPRYFDKLLKIMNDNKWTFNNDIRAFTLDKEELFSTTQRLYEARGDFDPKMFLADVLKIDTDLTHSFRMAPKNISEMQNVNNTSRIIDTLKLNNDKKTKKDMKMRHCMAKALILNVFAHPEQKSFDQVTSILLKDMIFLWKNYGQMARFLDHIKEHKHIYYEGDKIPQIPAKSYFKLKQNVTDIDFYNTLYSAILYDVIENKNNLSQTVAYDIRNIEVKLDQTSTQNCNNILIDIQLNPKIQEQVMKNMITTDGIYCATRTDLIRLVIRETNGFFDLITAYPVQQNEFITFNGDDMRKEVYETYEETFFPECLRERNSKRLELIPAKG